MATAATVLLMIGAAYTGYEGAIKTLSVIEMAGDIDNSRKELQAVEAELEEELQKKKDSGVDYMLVESAATVYNELEDKAMRPLPMFDVIGRSVGADLRLQSLEIKPVTLSDEEVAAAEAAAQAAESEPAEDDGGTPAAPPKQKQEYEIVIRLVFPPTLAPDIGVKKVGEIEAKLKASLPNHEVKIIKQVADLSYTGNFVGEVTSEKETDEKDKNLEAQIMIKGGLL
jgi:hypothetical protein